MSSYFKGVTVMIGSSALFSLMSLLIRYASGIDPFKTALFRFVVGMVILVTLALTGRIRLEYNNKTLLVVRGVAGGIAVFLFFLSISKIGLAKGTVISNTYPLFATIGGVLVLKERVRPAAWIFVVSCVLGMVLINYDMGIHAFRITVWDLLALAGSILSAVAVIAVRRLSRTDSPHAILMSQCVFGVWIVIVPANIIPVSLGLPGGMLLLTIGVIATVAQLMMTWAYGKLDVATGSLLSLLMMVFNVVFGVLAFHELQGAFVISGMVIVIISCAGIVSINRRPMVLRPRTA